MASEDICSTTRSSHVPKSQLKNAIRASIIVSVSMLRSAHAPNNSPRPVVCKCACNTLQLGSRSTGDALCFFRRPFGNFLLDVTHAPHTSADKLFVFPAIFKDVVQNTPYQSDISPWTESHILISVGGGSRETRIAHYHWRVVLFLGFHNMQQRNRVRFSRITADYEDSFGVVNVVIGIRHRPVAPGIRYPSNSR